MEEQSPNSPKKFIGRMVLGMLCGSAVVVTVLIQTQDLILAAVCFGVFVIGSAVVTWRNRSLGFVTGLIVGPITLCLGVVGLIWVICSGKSGHF